MNILIKLMSIVSLVIAPSLAQMTIHQTSQPANPTMMNQPPSTGTFQSRIVDGPAGPQEQMAYDEYRQLMTELEKEGVFNIEKNSILIKNGIVVIDGVPLDPALAVKYDHLIREITRVQQNSQDFKKE